MKTFIRNLNCHNCYVKFSSHTYFVHIMSIFTCAPDAAYYMYSQFKIVRLWTYFTITLPYFKTAQCLTSSWPSLGKNIAHSDLDGWTLESPVFSCKVFTWLHTNFQLWSNFALNSLRKFITCIYFLSTGWFISVVVYFCGVSIKSI